MRCLILICFIFLSAFSARKIDKYLKKDFLLSRAGKFYLEKRGPKIVYSDLAQVLIQNKIYDVEYIAIAGSFSKSSEFFKYVQKNLSWRIKNYSHYGYASKEKQHIAIFLKRYLRLGFHGFVNEKEYLISGELFSGVKQVMACMQSVNGRIFHVLPSSRSGQQFNFKFSSGITHTNTIFELIVQNKDGERRIANILRKPQKVSVNVKGPTFRLPSRAEEYLLEKINDERTARGMKALLPDFRLTILARNHSTKMLRKQKTFHSRLEEKVANLGEYYLYIAENVASAKTVRAVHDGFMQSPVHLKNILNPEIHKVGIGVKILNNNSKERVYVTQIFYTPFENKDERNNLVQSFTDFVNRKRIARGLLPLQRDINMFREARLFLNKRLDLNQLPDFFSLSKLNLRRIAYNRVNSSSLFMASKNPALYEKSFTHITVIPKAANSGKKTLILLAAYKK